MSAATAASAKLDAIIPWRMRGDLVARLGADGPGSGWTLKDPLSLTYFRLRDAEYSVLCLLDGQATYGRVLEALRRRFPDESWSLPNLHSFLVMLVNSGLVSPLRPGHALRVTARNERVRRIARWSWLTGLLAIRWKGIDPEPWLRRAEPITRWFFRPATIAVGIGLILSAALLVLLRWETLVQRLPEATSLFGLGNFLPLIVILIAIKLLHELGHVLTCRHYGGECHELGIQLVLFVPLFYGDVTDAWMLARRGPRIAISAAGIVVELLLASVATWLWWFSVPGVLNSMFLNIMLVCSVNTLLFNGNPLVRYDGYYALADWLKIPNLAQQARSAVLSVCERLLTGSSTDELEFRSGRAWTLIVYGIASGLYRLCVVVGIVWFLHQSFGRGLAILATAISTVMITGVVLSTCRDLISRIRNPIAEPSYSPHRLRNGLIVTVALIAGLLMIPLPYTVSAPFVLYPGDAQPVYVTVEGRLESAVPIGTSVAAGQSLGEFVNHNLSLERERQRAKVDRLAARLRTLEALRGTDETAALRLPATRDELRGAEERLKQLDREAERLQLRAPMAGIVLPPPNVPAVALNSDALPTWNGIPQDPINRGATLESQSLFCYVGDPQRHDAVLLVDQRSVEFVRPGQSVRLQLRSSPGKLLRGQVVEVASSKAENVPRELVVTHLAAARASGMDAVPVEVSYEVRVQVIEPRSQVDRLSQAAHALVTLYSPGRARIECGWLSLASRLWRLLRHTFSAELAPH
jgi:putative peptide zinc metalloprotease protein